MQNDKNLKIATSKNRKSKLWLQEELLWSDFIKRIGTPVVTSETFEQFMKLKKSQQDELKDVRRICSRRIKR